MSSESTSTSTSTSTPPKKPNSQHPAVQAILLAQHQHQQQQQRQRTDTDAKTNKTKTKAPSLKIQKVSQTLTWRSAHVKSPYYSLTMPISQSTTNTTNITNNNTTTLSIKQVQTKESDLYGTGAMVWPASLVLVKYLEWTKEEWTTYTYLHKHTNTNTTVPSGSRRTIRIADLGAGTGVTSIGMALLYDTSHIEPSLHRHDRRNEGDVGTAAAVTVAEEEEETEEGRRDSTPPPPAVIVCTDGCDLVVRLAEENVGRAMEHLNKTHLCDDHDDQNQATTEQNDDIRKENEDMNTNPYYKIGNCEIRLREYRWGTGTLQKELQSMPPSTTIYTERYFDIILISDCLLPKLYPIEPLVHAIDELSGPYTISYLSYEVRYYPEYDPKEFFIGLAKERGLEVEVVSMEDQHPVYSVEDIEIWKIRRKRE